MYMYLSKDTFLLETHSFSMYATPNTEPVENLADVPEDQIVETIETSDGPVASTVEYVHEIAKDVSHILYNAHYRMRWFSLNDGCIV